MKATQALLTAILFSSSTLSALAGGRKQQGLHSIPKLHEVNDISENIDDHSNERHLDASYSCFGEENFTVYFRGSCTYEELLERVELKILESSRCINTAKEEIALLMGYSDPIRFEDEVKDAVTGLCKAAMKKFEDDPTSTVKWSRVTQKGDQFDKEYYDGNTFWNEEYQTDYDGLIPGEPSNVLNRDAERVDDLYYTVASRTQFEWPDYMPNFEDCELRSAMCCWVSDRQAGDNNGNCATPYDKNCVDADPADNTDLCGVDMARSGTSSIHMEDGFAVFDSNSEGPVHCHGFAWGMDDMEPDARYKANNLFYVSMSDHMHDRGYVRNVPGAPMCGCVEKMPLVSRSDCTEIEALEVWQFDWKAATNTFDTSLDYVELKFNACRGAGRNNDLESFYQRLYNEGRATFEERNKFRGTVVGNDKCSSAIDHLLFNKGYKKI
mmetsp:Transcript_15515/g.22118  ORF Transcript_15515/g.22118 Transcript_15515/m.22118 type:complete len:439 (+) Transcript_15515:52-1368(+)|eukprot:CAMPEP_0184862858 /NCGR_PEP_ID=MMETSP0580-20130426/8113_1 /TAXON_ID=1118495 /ORGANISM="Dactyliosolen fragilissimus" /LENGTH=438 /DNA_ID=CAMNT_0027360871 /DNA_START=37 /DNA_END=1353 /DNA_ORIENTATION=+